MEGLIIVTDSATIPEFRGKQPKSWTTEDLFSSETGLPLQIDQITLLQGAVAQITTKFWDAALMPYRNLTSGPPIALITQGCKTYSINPNCTHVCNEASGIFHSWETQWNCLTLATVKLGLERLPPQERQEARQIINEAVLPLGVEEIMDFDAYNVFNHTFRCAAASCQDLSTGGCSVTIPENDWEFNSAPKLLFPVCEKVPSVVNGDITGPGVLVSYMIQNAIALYLCVLIAVYTLRRFLNRLLRYSCLKTSEPANAKLGPLSTYYPRLAFRLRSIEVSDQAQATAALLVDFQEANAFFLLAIQVALLYASGQSAIFFDLTNYKSLYDNLAQMQRLNSYSVVPLLLTQINLQRANLDSTYTLFLAIAAFSLMLITESFVGLPDGEAIWTMFGGSNTIAECSGFPSMRTLCLTETPEPPQPGIGQVRAIGPLASVMGMLLMRKLWVLLQGMKWFHKRLDGMKDSGRRNFRLVLQICALVNNIFIFAMQVYLVFQASRSIAVISAQLQKPTQFQPDNSVMLIGQQWNMGQIITVLVWAPVLSKYLFTTLRGVQSSFGVRIIKPFKIVKEQDGSNHKDDVPTTSSQTRMIGGKSGYELVEPS